MSAEIARVAEGNVILFFFSCDLLDYTLSIQFIRGTAIRGRCVHVRNKTNNIAVKGRRSPIAIPAPAGGEGELNFTHKVQTN